MTAPVAPTGTKRKCSACAAKFYDLGKKPAICPKCNTELIDPDAIVS